jgi:flagella basal body P-ring formation protein FlgA
MKNARLDSLLRAAVLLAVAVAAVALPSGADTVILKDEAHVKGPKVLLGDVAEIEGENAEALKAVELVAAASPGSARRIDASLVGARLERAGIPSDAVEIAGADSVEASTLALEVTPDMLEEDLRRFIETQMPWDPAEATVFVDVPEQAILVPDGDVQFSWRPASRYGYLGSSAVRGEIRVDGALKRTVLCKATVEAYGDVVVATRDIPAGQTIGPHDVALEQVLLGESQQDIVRSLDEAVGFVTRTGAFAGQPVSRRGLVPPLVIKRGQIVNVEVRTGGLVVRTLAKAKADGRAGESILCINPESKEEYPGTVRSDGTVVVE